MEQKQFNVPMPLFSHDEFSGLLETLRGGGSKPTKGDLVAALIHAAVQDTDATKWAVEDFVKFELRLEAAEQAAGPGGDPNAADADPDPARA